MLTRSFTGRGLHVRPPRARRQGSSDPSCANQTICRGYETNAPPKPDLRRNLNSPHTLSWTHACAYWLVACTPSYRLGPTMYALRTCGLAEKDCQTQVKAFERDESCFVLQFVARTHTAARLPAGQRTTFGRFSEAANVYTRPCLAKLGTLTSFNASLVLSALMQSEHRVE